MSEVSEITDAEVIKVAEPAVRLAAMQSGLPFDLDDAHDYIDSMLTLVLALTVGALDRATDSRDVAACRAVIGTLMRVAILS
jgi:hypothetical protein